MATLTALHSSPKTFTIHKHICKGISVLEEQRNTFFA